MVDAYKWDNCRDAATELGTVLVESLPKVPPDTRFVPIPTIAAHRRRRGYDHTKLMAEALVARCGGCVTPLLVRRTNSVQIGKSRTERLKQAKKAYTINTHYMVDRETPYVIVDDVYTTGATVNAAAHLLREAGAQNVWVAVATRQPLD
ncbi:MAG TPA: phosphoribosyltransferase family protein [Candidatus Saccharimonadaceae bacterium]|nr:phosphoribosyltransferase family protein [Candidatus Saccharimonadaceae bacterium]